MRLSPLSRSLTIGTAGRRTRPARKARLRLNIGSLEDRTVPAVTLTAVPDWVDQGPGPILNGNNVILPAQGRPQVGAVHGIATVPANPNRVYIASVNGGIWRSDNATFSQFDGVNNDGDGATDEADENPTWIPLTDALPTPSLGSVAVSPLDGAGNTVFAGAGRFSNGFADGGALLGMFRTTDAGATWTAIGGTTFDGITVERILPTGLGGALATQPVLAATSNGVYRSPDGGNTWARLSNALATGDGVDNDADGTTDEAGERNLPNGYSTDVVADPGNANRFYASINGQGVARSDDGGVTWRMVNGTAPNNITGIAGTSRIELSVSAAAPNPVYVGLISGAGALTNVFRSADQGANWNVLGAAPNTHPGGQGGFNFSIVADPNNNNIVFVGGDRGTINNAGNIFRGDSNTNTWVSIANAGASGTAPHPDSRDMVFSFVPDGVGGTVPTILQGDDGGLYRLRQPNGPAPVWDSVLGDMRITEFWSVAYDAFNQRIFGGTQDNSTPEQNTTGGIVYTDRLGGDGAIVQVEYRDTDNNGTLDLSNRYMSRQNFGGFSRVQFDAGNPGGVLSTVTMTVAGANGRTVNGAGTQPFGNPPAQVFDNTRQFVNPHIINAVNPNRLLIGTSFLYESFDQGTNVTALGGLTDLRTNGIDEDGDGSPANDPDEWAPANPVGSVTAMAYGGRLGGADAPDVAYVGTNGGTIGGVAGTLFRRNAIATAGSPVLGDFTTLNNYPGVAPNDIVLDPDNWQRGYVVDNNGQVFRFVNGGAAAADWTNITGNLGALLNPLSTADPSVPALLRTVQLYTATAAAGDDVVLVGGQAGVYRTLNPGPGAVWTEFGGALPNALVSDLRYDARDDVLLVGTRGRGAWTIANATATLPVTSVLQIDGDTNFPGQDDTIRLVRNPNNPSMLDVYLNSVVPTKTVQLASIQQINVNGLGGNDTLIVDSTNGLITVANGIRYNGGTGVDNLRLDQTGGPTRTSATYDLGPTPGTGKHTINGGGAAGTQTVFFEDLSPVLDLVPAGSLTVNATPAVNAISYTTGTLVTQGRVTVDEQESIEFANHGTLVLNAGGGGDTVSLNNPNPVDGLTGITVNGGDPTSGDALIVNGTAATTSVNTGTRTITGAGTVPITYDLAIEALTVNAGPSTTLALTGSTTYTYTPGAAANAGTVQTVQIPIAFTGIGAGETLTLTGTSALINGTAGNDTFTASGAAGTVTLGGRATIGGTAVGTATLDGQDGADTVTATGNGGAVTAALGVATPTLTGGGLGSMSFPNVEVVNLNAGAGAITVNGTAGPNVYAVTPTGANAATVQVGGATPVLNTTNTGALTIADGTAGDGDLLTVIGTAAGETITVDSAAATITVGGLKAVAYSAANVEGLRVNGNAGADRFDVTPGSRPMFIDGGDPVGVLPGDLLNFVAGGQTVTVTPGPETDEGGIDVGANATVSYDHVESISITGGGPAVVNGTNGNDAITVVARDSSYSPAADGVQDFTAAVNTGPEILFIDSPSVTVNALGGADLVTVRTPAPNNAVWDVAVTVDGGPPSAGSPPGADRLVVETPGPAAEAAVYTPTASDAGTLGLASLTSPIGFTGIEELLYDGEADGDSLTIVGTAGANTFTATPGAAPDAGTLAVDGTLPIAYQNLGPTGQVNVTGNGGSDTLVYNGTAVNDLFTINAGGGGGVVTLNSQLPINTTGVGTLRAAGFAGDDTFTLVPAISGSPYAILILNGGAQASAAGDQANLKGTPGPAADSITVSGQSVALGGVTVASSGVENINLDSDGGTDLLTYNGVSGVTEAISVAGSSTPGTGVLSVPGVAQVTFVNTETFVVNGNPADVDTVKVVGTNAVDRLEIDLAAAGTGADPVLLLQNAAGTTTALTLLNYTGFNVLNVDALDGDDVVNVYTAATGPSRNLMLDGGAPAGKNKGTDLLNVYYAGRRPRIVHSAATQNPHSGLVTLDYGTAFFSVQYASMEDVRILKL